MLENKIIKKSFFGIQMKMVYLCRNFFLKTFTMDELKHIREILRQPVFRWLPKHLNHIAENIKLKNRNISFLAINALFRSDAYELDRSALSPDAYTIKGHVPIQKNDLLRPMDGTMTVVFYLDRHKNIIPLTAYSENDEYDRR
jgi:hypothetical protein